MERGERSEKCRQAHNITHSSLHTPHSTLLTPHYSLHFPPSLTLKTLKEMKSIYIIIGVALTLAACNPRQSDAENAVADFMEKNITNPEKMKITGFSRLDSTSKVKDSVVVAIRKATDSNGRYKKGITYHQADNHAMLYMLRVNYTMGKDEMCDTYYLDKSLQNVVAVKNN